LNLAENGSNNGKRGPYKPVQKARIKQEIYNRILQGYPYQDIMEYLRMPERTFYNYLAAIREEEKDFLKDTISKDKMKWQTQLCHDRLEASLNRLHKWTDDPNFKDKVGAMHLICEINAAIMRLYVYGPSYVKRYEENNNNNDAKSSNSNNQKEEEQNNKELLELRRLNQELAKEEKHMHYVDATAAQWEDFQRRKKKFLEKYYPPLQEQKEEEVSEEKDSFGFT
jgi:DNA-binding CsgD family transcriptional regulator